MAKRTKRAPEHYVNNAQFSQAVVEYVDILQKAKSKDQPLPMVPNYVAECFLKIANGLSHKSNFIRYTYREELVMDAVENCLRAIANYNIEAATRTGKPNAFAYFTQISWYAFLRRIAKEKKQQDIKLKYLAQTGIETLAMVDLNDKNMVSVTTNFVNTLRSRIDKVKEYDTEVTLFAEQEAQKEKKKRRINVASDSDLERFM